jgi:hypothetical protein
MAIAEAIGTGEVILVGIPYLSPPREKIENKFEESLVDADAFLEIIVSNLHKSLNPIS